MKVISKILEIILDIIIVIMAIAVIIALVYVSQTKILKKEYADIFGYTAFEVVTGSMSSTIEIGDVVIVKITDDVKENDIIVFEEDGSFITHRIIEIDGQTIITKGDANNSEDRPIQENQILGKVVNVVPKVAIWKKVFMTPEVLISIMIAIIILGILFLNKKTHKEEN